MYKKITIFLLIFSVFFITACDSNIDLKYKSIQNTLEFLTSNECNGRLVGTNGNLLTQKFIINSLKSFNIEGYDGKYNDEFLYNQFSINEVALETSQKKFIYEKDFFINKISNTDINYPLAIKTSTSDDCIVLLENENSDEMEELLLNDKVRGILIKTGSIIPFTPKEKSISNKTIFHVANETYEYLKENIGTIIHLKSSYTVTEKPANNIIGIIRGNDAKKAIVLSAHFDHVGSVSNHIFRGAIDNASGTAALLNIAKRISESVKESNINMDIIFAFFNAEEIGTIGSENFVKRIQSKYGSENITNINIDCIGNLNDTVLNINYSQDDLQGVSYELINLLNKKSITNIEEKKIASSYVGSDHIWFYNNIYMYMESNNIHTIKDTIDGVDIKLTGEISECVADLILNFPNNAKQVTGNQISTKRKSTEEFIQDEERKLEPFEYKFMDIDGEVKCIESKQFNGSYEEVNKHFNGELDTIPLNKLINETSYNNFSFIFSYAEDVKYTSQLLNTVYKRNYKYKDMNQFSILVLKDKYDSSNVEIKDKRMDISLNIHKIDYSYKFEGNKLLGKKLGEGFFNYLSSDFGSDILDYKGLELHYKYVKDIGGKIQCVSKNSNDQVKYVYIITTKAIEGFNKDKIIKLIDEYEIFNIFEAIEQLMNKLGETSYENGNDG